MAGGFTRTTKRSINGTYTIPELTGTAPFRIEACGYAGANYQCNYSVAQGAGTANVTSVTTATVLLASGKSPADLMDGDSTALTASALNSAQVALRDGMVSALAAGTCQPRSISSTARSTPARAPATMTCWTPSE